MVSIRLARRGAKKRPFYHIVATDRRNKRDGRALECLGFFNPCAKGPEETMRIDTERLEYWLGQGGQASARVKSLLARHRKDERSAADAGVAGTDVATDASSDAGESAGTTDPGAQATTE